MANITPTEDLPVITYDDPRVPGLLAIDAAWAAACAVEARITGKPFPPVDLEEDDTTVDTPVAEERQSAATPSAKGMA
jgi:hypothetical protein